METGDGGEGQWQDGKAEEKVYNVDAVFRCLFVGTVFCRGVRSQESKGTGALGKRSVRMEGKAGGRKDCGAGAF